jgi:NADH:ubiquinone oxidoreductase subunit K
MVIFTILAITKQKNHILNTLLLIEYLIIILFLFINFQYFEIYGPITISLYFLAFAACEAAIGLTLLVTLLQNIGIENLSSIILTRF